VNDLPFWIQLIILIGLLLLSAFFSISETSLMAVNKYRIRSLAGKGSKGAKQVLNLLKRTDKLLGTILLGNNIINAALTALVTAIAINAFGNNDQVLALATGTAALMLIIFAELIPKVAGANRPDGIAMGASYGLIIFTWIFHPFVLIINKVVSLMLSAANLEFSSQKNDGLTSDELRSAILESSTFIPLHNRKIFLNLLDLEGLSVDHVMVSRGRVEFLNLEDNEAVLREQISTSFHNKLLVCNGDLNQIEGVLHIKKAIGLLADDRFTKESIMEEIRPAYFVPVGTKLFSQLQNFQERKENLAVIVDEYGEVEGLVTLQDIIEELVGEFTTNNPEFYSQPVAWNIQGDAIVDALTSVRELNRNLGLNLPTNGPRTLNGLILEALEDLPKANLSLKIHNLAVEILTVQGQLIKKVRLRKPKTSLQTNSSGKNK
jgi:Mg2+/Co2+ transporter CorB